MHKGSKMTVETRIKEELLPSSPTSVSPFSLLFQMLENWDFLPF